MRAIKKLVEANAIEVEIIPNQKTISHGKSDINVLQWKLPLVQPSDTLKVPTGLLFQDQDSYQLKPVLICY